MDFSLVLRFSRILVSMFKLIWMLGSLAVPLSYLCGKKALSWKMRSMTDLGFMALVRETHSRDWE